MKIEILSLPYTHTAVDTLNHEFVNKTTQETVFAKALTGTWNFCVGYDSRTTGKPGVSPAQLVASDDKAGYTKAEPLSQSMNVSTDNIGDVIRFE